MRYKKSTQDLEKEASKTYNIQALWQQSRDLGITSRVNSPVGLEQSRELPLPNSPRLFTSSLILIDKKNSTGRSIEKFD